MKYEYAFKDHLGNTRLMFCDKNGDGIIQQQTDQTSSEITQENHFYPFGLNMEGAWSNTPSITDNKYQYNGKELVSDFGLEWNDYGARMYDASIGRWNAPEPMAQLFKKDNSYGYVSNNPILNIDVKGNFKLPASIRALYPHFAAYLDNNISEILKSKKIMANLERFSGGKLTREVVEKDIKNGNGPDIETGNRDFNDGRGGVLLVDGQFNLFGKNEIFISEVLLSDFEKAMKNDKVVMEVKQAILLNVVAVLLHEYVHYGDRDDDYAEDENGKRRPSTGENDFEEGDAFNYHVYGFETGRIPGFPGAGFDLESSYKFVTKPSETKKGEKENKDEIPTVPKV